MSVSDVSKQWLNEIYMQWKIWILAVYDKIMSLGLDEGRCVWWASSWTVRDDNLQNECMP